MELITLARSRRPTTMQCAKALCTNHFTMVILILLVVLISSSEAQRLCADSSPPSPGCICYPGQTNAPDCNRLACGNRQFSPLAQSTYLHAKKKLTENQITRFTEPASTTPYRLQVYQNSTSRAAFDPIIAGASGNLGCGEQCTSGFAGSTCNICQNTDSCQKGISSASSSGLPGLGSATTGDVICSKEPIAYTANFGQCLIDNPMIKSLLPGKLEASIQRYPDPTSASLPTSSIAGLAAGSTTVTLLYAPNTTAPLQDQFTCQANNCTQQVKDKVYSMSCQSLKCKLQLLAMSAWTVPWRITLLQTTESKRSELIDGDKSSISGGLIAGLVIVALIIAAFFGLVAFGFYRQRLARKTTGTPYSQTSAAARVEWSNLRYHLPMKSGAGSILRRRKAPPASTADLEAIQSPTSKSSHSSHGPNPLSYGPQILCGLSGSVEAGTMMAILGPSGAGKSTFLDVLAGQQKVGLVSGRRHISLPGEPDEPIVVGFVDQSDILPPTSTVREALMFSARLKLPEHVSYDERERRVSEVIDLLGLSKVVDSRIGDEEKRGLSGGERRRLSIGLELIARPSVLFLDEPTSSQGIVNWSRNGHGTTIICSIHQPNSQIYHAFDYVCLLAPGGRQIYCGPTSEAVNYLGSRGLQCPAEFNPADFLLEVASEPPVGFLDQCTEPDQMKCETSKEEHSRVAMLEEGSKLVLVPEYIINNHRSLRRCHVLPSELENFWLPKPCWVFVFHLRDIRLQFLIGSDEFLSREGIIHARKGGRILFADGVAHSLASEGTRFIKYLLILLELGLVQTMFNMWLGASIRNLGTAVFLASMINLLQLGFAGFFVNLTSMTKVLRWVQYVIPLKFALEAMTTNEVSAGLMIDDNLQGINVKVSASLIMNLLFGFKEDANVIILFGFFLFLASLLVLTVIRKLRQVK
ncbi:hypothetical protein PSHT_00303 [Puccinia striiformis]|uniref:ABC transporter domain-containing protein n=1 Tax=Puccinia striiformis TaxID=27350 RepID=A0A2S4WNL9_9BASI|nr:hypothetical protein PSHT_00303 [Puccinia striiformis]